MPTLSAQSRVVKTPPAVREPSRGLAGADAAGTSPTVHVWPSGEGRADLRTYVRVQLAKRVRGGAGVGLATSSVSLTVDLDRFGFDDLPVRLPVCERGRRFACVIAGVDPRPETNSVAVTYACDDRGEDEF
ncbi:hypothetical protein [Alienimonas sp. DA493]|uniref:hypothetical protein n=1 Tax=Alienimonas sp. DA493 TaxID=3373605 RepID=UPI0037545222